MSEWVQSRDEGAVISIRVVPRSSTTKIDGVLGDALKIRLQAPPVDGKANKALVKFLAKKLGVSSGQVCLLGGETNRNKRVLIAGYSAEQVEAKLLQK